ncbi:MAG: hypothetical protein ABIO37_00820 [Caulobacteraceae bacterium]
MSLVASIPPPAQAAAPAKTVARAAPKPTRLADGSPNWTGFWTPVGGLLDRNFGPGFVVATPVAPTRPAPPPAFVLKSPYKERYAELLKQTEAGKVIYDPGALCLPSGMPRMMTMVYGMEVLQTRGQVTITSEYGATSRRIWTDGRKHPPADELDPTYAGHSIGHWEKDSLVVDTVGLRGDTVIEQSGLMHSDKMRLTERFFQESPGLLVDEITVIDPDVFEAPWKIVKRYGYRPELSLQEFVCENNRNVDANGAPTFK